MWVRYVPRALLCLAVVNYGFIGLLYLIEPALIGRTGVEVTSAVGFISVRAGIGGFHLGVGLIALYCVASPARVFAGLAIASTFAAVVVATRLSALVTGGFDAGIVGLMMPEALSLLIFAGGALLEAQQQSKSPETAS